MYNKPDVVTRIHGDQINDGYSDSAVILYNDPSPVGEGNGNPLQYSCLENPIDRGALWAIVHGGCKESDTTEEIKPACMCYLDLVGLFMDLLHRLKEKHEVVGAGNTDGLV